MPTRVTYENTYITEPEGYGPGTRFERHKVKEVLDEMLTARLQNQQYDPVKSSQISKMLADDLRERVRSRHLLLDRVSARFKFGHFESTRSFEQCLSTETCCTFIT